MRRLPALLVLAFALPAAAEPVVLRIATVAPDGTSWAREVKAFAREVERETSGNLRIKFYFGGVAGDEIEELERVKRRQLDGAALAVTCSRLAPSLRITRVVGLFVRPEEVHYVLNGMLPTLDAEFRKSGFVSLGHALAGSDVIFSREPVRTLEDLRRLRFWVWNNDEVWLDELPRLGLKVVPGSINSAGEQYDEGRVDGFLAVPTAALALQWSAQARFYTPLRIAFLPACLVVAARAFDALPHDWRAILKGAAAKMAARFEEVNLAHEQELLGGLFDRQGDQAVDLSGPAGSELRTAFFREARQVRGQIPETVVPRATIDLANSWLADYRADEAR